MSEENEEQSFEDAFEELTGGVSDSAPEEAVEEIVDAEEEEREGEAGVLEAGEEEDVPASIEEQLATTRSELQQWQHKYNSDLGRQHAYQRQLQEKEQQIAHLQKVQQNANPGISNDRWKVVADDYPDIAEGVQSLFQQQTQQHKAELDRVRSELQPIQQQAHQSYIDQQFAMLEQEHPDYRELATSNEFKQWVETQPHPVQQMIQSEQAGDAAYLLRAYKNDVSPGQQATSELKQRREKQLRQGQTVPSRGGRQKSNMPPEEDFDAAFDFFASRK